MKLIARRGFTDLKGISDPSLTNALNTCVVLLRKLTQCLVSVGGDELSVLPSLNLPLRAIDVRGFSDTLPNMQTQTDPFPGGVPDAAEFLTEELARIRYQLAAIMGQPLWYEDPATSMIGLGNLIGGNLASIGTNVANIAVNAAAIGVNAAAIAANVGNIAANLVLINAHAARHAAGGADALPNNAINSAMIANGAIMNVDINAAAAIAWGKIAADGNLTYDNVNEVIGNQWTFNQQILAPGLQRAGNVLISSTGGNVSLTAPAGNIYLNPSGKIYAQDDLVCEGDLMRNAALLRVVSTSDTHLDVQVETDAIEGGFYPEEHETGRVGGAASAFLRINSKGFYAGTDGYGNYDERKDLEDLRATQPYVDSQGRKMKITAHGDGVFDSNTIPMYLRDKDSITYYTEKGTPNSAYVDQNLMIGWIISLLKSLDVVDIKQDEQMDLALEEILVLKQENQQLGERITELEAS